MITITVHGPVEQEAYADQIRACRAVWTEATGLRTYAASWLRTDATFESDKPWQARGEQELEAAVAKLSRFGYHVRLDIRRTRMSVWVTIDPETLQQQLSSLAATPTHH